MPGVPTAVPRVRGTSRIIRRLAGGGSAASRIQRIGLLLVLIQLAIRAWALSGSWFYFDDLAFMSRAMNSPMNLSYLTESYGGHLMPGGFALVWALTKLAVFQWWVWAAVLLIMQAVAGVGMLRLLRSMFGDTPAVLVLLTGYLVFVFTLSAGIWFAAGVNQLPMQIALVFGLHAHVEYLRTRRRRHWIAALAWTLFGLLFYEKTLLVFGIYALVALCWFGSGNTPERLAGIWRDYREGVIAYAVVATGYLALYAAYGLNFTPSTASNTSLTPIAWNLIAVAGASALVGGPLTWRPISVGSFADPSQMVQLIGWLAVGTLVYHAFKSRTISRRAWSLIGFTLIADVVLLGSARANIVGPDIALEYRYQTETAALFVLSAGLALLPLRGARESNAIKPDAPRTYETRPVVLGLTGVVVLAALISTQRYVHLWQDGNPTKSYYANVASSLAKEAKALDTRVPLVDQGIPQTMLWGYRYPENTYSHVFRNLSTDAAYPQWSMDSLYIFDDRGQLSPVVIPDTRAMASAGECVRRSEKRLKVPLNGPVQGGGWWIRMSYFSKAKTTMHVMAGEVGHDLELPAGLHNTFFSAAGDFDTVVLSNLDPSSRLCVTDLALGLPQPAEAPR